MKARVMIALLLTTVMLMMASTPVPGAKQHPTGFMLRSDTLVTDSTLVVDSLPHADTVAMDSLKLAIFNYNKAIDDSLKLDSLNKARPNGIEAPVKFTANDSIVYDAITKDAFLYGDSKVDYQDMNLSSERVQMNLNNSLVYATGVADSTETKGLKGTPVFKMGSDEYESDTINYNFKSKKGFINNVYTEQQDGYIRSQHSKRDANGNLYLEHGTYTTCDEEHPDFYIALSRAKVRPGKDVVFGSAYLVVADVPLPLAIPYGFFPFTKSYSSGFIMPTYGDESSRGFYLRDGGYYFAMNDKWDLKLLGEIYTKGSWGLSAASNYRKRYRYSGSLLISYMNTKTGDKGMPDFVEKEDFKMIWSHRQDQKANPYSSLSANVNFATSSYETNNLTSMYNPQARTQTTRTSSVNYSTSFSSLGMTITSTANIGQYMRDTTISITLPDLNIMVSKFYPFKRKKAVGEPRWYERISMSYTGQFSNQILTKENKLLHSNLIKDWKNGFRHTVPINCDFTLFNYLNVTPTFTINDRMYTSKITRSWDEKRQVELADTTYGFHNLYDWNMSLQLSTKVYGFWVPSRKIFGNKIDRIRHVVTPTVSISYSPDFTNDRYGYVDYYQKTDANGNVTLVKYSPYSHGIYGVPSNQMSGRISMSLSNNLEMKIRNKDDSIKKISLIDELGIRTSYNMSDKQRPWDNLTMSIRLKWWKRYTFSLNAVFATYAYDLDENGVPYIGTHTEWSRGRFGRFQGMTQNFSFTLNPEKLKKWFGGGDKKDEDEEDGDYDGIDTDLESNIDPDLTRGQHGAKKKEKGKAETDDDGYMLFNMPWSLTFGYGITMRENTHGKFNTKTMRYPYSFSQTLNMSGNIRLSEGWNISFTSGYDFDFKKLTMTTASLSRDLHCFSMSCSVVLAPYTSYNFTFRCNASTLTDALKYDKRSGQSNAVRWY